MDSSDWNVESLFSLSARVDCFGEVFCVAEGIEAIISFDDVVDNSEAVSVAVSNNASDMVGKNFTWPVRKVSNGRGIGKEAADAIHDDIFCPCVDKSSDVSNEASDKDISRLTFVICATSGDGTGSVSCIDKNLSSAVSKNMKLWLSGNENGCVIDGVNSDSEEIANAVFDCSGDTVTVSVVFKWFSCEL